MIDFEVRATARDPLIFRDARPFNPGISGRMHIYDWAPPSVFTGALRSVLGLSAGVRFENPEALARLLQVEVRGPLPAVSDTLYFPNPQDVKWGRDENSGKRLAIPLRPHVTGENEGFLEPDSMRGERFLLCSAREEAGCASPYKSDDIPPKWWPADRMIEWLSTSDSLTLPDMARFIDKIEVEDRMHVSIDPTSKTARDGLLFQTSGLCLSWASAAHQPIEIAACIENDKLTNVLRACERCAPIGGERRVAQWATKAPNKFWQCPDRIRHALSGRRFVRMVLATPAIFQNGWRPGWLDEDNGKTMFGCELKLVSALLDRYIPVGGWDYRARGHKALRRAVPRGSVYFFEVTDGDATRLSEQWLRSVCDNPQDRRDGWGLALWGVCADIGREGKL